MEHICGLPCTEQIFQHDKFWQQLTVLPQKETSLVHDNPMHSMVLRLGQTWRGQGVCVEVAQHSFT